MDSEDKLPHWSVLIGCKTGGSGTKNKEAKLGKRKASSSPTSSVKTKIPSRSPKKRRTNTGKARAIPAVSEIIEISSDDEQVNCPTAVRSRSKNTKAPFNIKAEKRPKLVTRSPESNNTPAHGTRAHATTPASRPSKSYFGRLCTGQKLDFIPRTPIKSVSGKEGDEDARSMTLDTPTDSEAPANLSRTYFERICKWVGHDVDFNVERINLRGSNTL
ncbi:hypothetical protein EV421DRAFT_1960874 [Armillaria borealis]|uniref:Uncharacterized protein n=1 Tax=Armillaria borealis TaxID=47425 RepID=A0AA39IC80_9AGAR|nr:hypothetical protein EV421DRAFT_1960874 [Armillaria borealis]